MCVCVCVLRRKKEGKKEEVKEKSLPSSVVTSKRICGVYSWRTGSQTIAIILSEIL